MTKATEHELPPGQTLEQDAAQDKERREAQTLAEAFAGTGAAERERLSRIMDLLPCYVILIDGNNRILFHNKAFEEFFGKPGERLCHEILRNQPASCRMCLPRGSLNQEGSGVMEWVHAPSGHAFRVHYSPFTDTDGTPCILKVGYNITASLRVQQALDLSEQSYRAITDNLSIGIALLDPKLCIKAGNIRLSQWFGEGFRLDRTVCELLKCGADHGRAVSDPAYFCEDCPFKASLRNGAGHEKELAVAFQDGKERIVRLVTCPVMPGKSRSKKPQVRAIIMMLEDITNRLRVNQQLQRARKLEAMNTLAGGIAHEINQPLSALHLYAGGLQMLLEKQRELPPETTKERLNLIMKEADKIRSIITHMRSLVMREKPAPLGAVSLEAGVRNVMAVMGHQFAARGVKALLDLPPGLPPVRANDVQFEQVLVNLLANALHAIDGDQAKSRERRIVLIRARLAPETGSVRLEVADSGPGLGKGSEQIFDPFFTTKERHEGMGLGLSIVHGLVSLWGGEISAVARHPELGGAAFYIDLKLADGSEALSGDAETPRPEPVLLAPAGSAKPGNGTDETGEAS